MRDTFQPRRVSAIVCLLCFTAFTTASAAKVHVVALGKWISVQLMIPSGEAPKPLALKIRPLVIDGRIKEYVVGSPHEVTERLFVALRVFRVNDGLPEDSTPRWQWQRGGWLLVDRLTGRISAINLSDFDPLYSAASWYRDYVSYCGINDDGKKVFAIVAQVGRRKPVLKKQVSEGIPEAATTDPICPAPVWQRDPMRVTFDVGGTHQTFSIRGHVVDLVTDTDEEEE